MGYLSNAEQVIDMDNEEITEESIARSLSNGDIIKKYKAVFFDNNDLDYSEAKKMLNEAGADERAKEQQKGGFEKGVEMGVRQAKAKIVEMPENDAKLLEDFKTISAGNKAEALRTAIQKIKEMP